MLLPPVVERPRKAGFDAWGVRYELREEVEGGTFPASNGHPIESVDQWCQQILVPDVGKMNWDDISCGWAGKERLQPDRIDRDEVVVCGILEFGLFERSYLLLGMENALVGYMTNPVEMEALVSAIADYKIALVTRFHEAAKLDMVWYGDDWGTQENLFLPPKVWRRIIKPHTRRIYARMKELGILIDQHSCGKIEAVLGDMVEMGADVWNPCQPCNDLAGLKQRYGDRIAFCGGIDSQFVLGRPGVTPDEVRVEVRKRIDELARGGGYIASPSHSVPYDPDVVAALNDEIRSYGRLCYAI